MPTFTPYGVPTPIAGATHSPMEGFAQEFTRDLQGHLQLCEEIMALTARENQALGGGTDYPAFDFCHQRKNLLPRLDKSLMALRTWRQRWQQLTPAERAVCADIKTLFQAVQGLLMKILLLDRENQQALLRRGLVPAQHLPAAAVQQPHCVVDAYRRHARR